MLAATPPTAREGMRLLFALDDRLASIVRHTREPLVGQMRLTWWHDALGRLDTEAAPAEPLLQALQRDLLPRGVTGAALAGIIDGWEELITAETLDADALARYADARGGRLFALAGTVLEDESPLLHSAGRGWALADLSSHLSIVAAATLASDLAVSNLDRAFSARWPMRLRPIAMLSLLASMDRSPGSPVSKALRVARFRLTGR